MIWLISVRTSLLSTDFHQTVGRFYASVDDFKPLGVDTNFLVTKRFLRKACDYWCVYEYSHHENYKSSQITLPIKRKNKHVTFKQEKIIKQLKNDPYLAYQSQ